MLRLPHNTDFLPDDRIGGVEDEVVDTGEFGLAPEVVAFLARLFRAVNDEQRTGTPEVVDPDAEAA